MIDCCHSLPFLATPGKGHCLQNTPKPSELPLSEAAWGQYYSGYSPVCPGSLLECCLSKHMSSRLAQAGQISKVEDTLLRAQTYQGQFNFGLDIMPQFNPSQQLSTTQLLVPPGWGGGENWRSRSEYPSSSFCFPLVYMLSMTTFGLRYPFAQLGSAVTSVCVSHLLVHH